MRFLVGLACGLLVATVAYIEWDATRPALQQVLDRLPDMARQHVQTAPRPATPVLDEPAERSAVPEVDAPAREKSVAQEQVPAEQLTDNALPDEVFADANRLTDAIEAPATRPNARNAETARPVPAVHTLPPVQPSTVDLPVPAFEVPRPDTPVANVPEPAVPLHTPTESTGIAIVWEQFRSEVTARGFAGFVARSTGREFDVLPQALGRYAVVYRYSNEADLEAALAAVEQVAERGVAL